MIAVEVRPFAAIWEQEPNRLWSLVDMRRFFNATFNGMLTQMEQARGRLVFTHNEEALNELRVQLDNVRNEFESEQVSRLLTQQLARLIKVAEVASADSDYELAMLIDRVGELEKNLIEELATYLFFVVPPSCKWIYLDPQKWFSESIIIEFPEADRDIRDACQCFALAQWTAAVFHSMRILEIGLRSLASDLGLTNLDDENWKNILDLIEKEVRKIEAEPKSADKIARAKFYSEACIQFRYFKDAWRNHVSHGKQSYDEQDALAVLTHVRDFMRHLAGGRN